MMLSGLPSSMAGDPLVRFYQRLQHEWLPTYCHDKERQYAVDGFKNDFRQLAAVDASDFIDALRACVVVDTGGGRYRAPRSKANEVIFWEGKKNCTPRPITLWLEPIITIAAVGRLHRDYGWPAELLGLQSKDGAFDLVAYKGRDSDHMAIAGEVKKTVRGLESMVEHLRTFAENPQAVANVREPVAVNAARKWTALGKERPPLFWAVGPGGSGEVFAVAYDVVGPREFEPVPYSRLLHSVASGR